MGKAASPTPPPPYNAVGPTDDTLRRLVDFQTEAQSKLFDKAATYNNIVVSLGYAGFISLWAWARDIIHAWDASLIAFLLGISLFFFVLWNVVTTYVISVQNIRLAKAINQPHPTAEAKLSELNRCESEIRRISLRYFATWYFVFLGTAITGFISGALLILLIGTRIIGFEVGVHTIIGIE